MLRIDNTNTNMSASSVVEDVLVASFSASINAPAGDVYIGINYSNRSIVQANVEAFKADLDAFIDSIINRS